MSISGTSNSYKCSIRHHSVMSQPTPSGDTLSQAIPVTDSSDEEPASHSTSESEEIEIQLRESAVHSLSVFNPCALLIATLDLDDSSRRPRRRRNTLPQDTMNQPPTPAPALPAPAAAAAPPVFRAGVAYTAVPSAPLMADSSVFGSRWQVVVRGRHVGIFSQAQTSV